MNNCNNGITWSGFVWSKLMGKMHGVSNKYLSENKSTLFLLTYESVCKIK